MRTSGKNRFAVTIVGVICAFLPGACQQQNKGGPPAFMTGTPEVTVVEVKSEAVPIVTELPARACAPLVAEIRPQVGGIITKRLFEEGTNVKAGDILYQIDPSPYQAVYNSAKAALAKAEANLIPTRVKAERYNDLVAIKGVSQQECDEAFAALKQAEAEIEVGKAALDTARIDLQNTRVIAPITGRIGKSAITVGALATTNQASAFATIQQLDPIFVDAAQSSASLLRLRREMTAGETEKAGNERTRVKLLLEDGTEYPFEGHLKFSDVTVDSGTGSYIVRMSFPNPGGVLMPGMYVRARIQEGTRRAAILAPQQAVARDAKGRPYVFVVDGDGKARQQQITIDRTIGDRWLVSAGLSAGDRVIVEGLQKVRPGQKVKAFPLDASSKAGMEPDEERDKTEKGGT